MVAARSAARRARARSLLPRGRAAPPARTARGREPTPRPPPHHGRARARARTPRRGGSCRARAPSRTSWLPRPRPPPRRQWCLRPARVGRVQSGGRRRHRRRLAPCTQLGAMRVRRAGVGFVHFVFGARSAAAVSLRTRARRRRSRARQLSGASEALVRRQRAGAAAARNRNAARAISAARDPVGAENQRARPAQRRRAVARTKRTRARRSGRPRATRRSVAHLRADAGARLLTTIRSAEPQSSPRPTAELWPMNATGGSHLSRRRCRPGRSRPNQTTHARRSRRSIPCLTRCVWGGEVR